MQNYAHPEILAETSWLAAHLADPQVRVIEIDGSRTAYDEGHIPGAIFWSAYSDIAHPNLRVKVDQATAEALLGAAGITPQTTVVLYSGRVSAMGLAFWYLKLFGHRDVRLLNGGRKKWLAEGRPLTRDMPQVTPAQYSAQPPDASIRALREQVAAALDAPDHAIVDTRHLREYSGELFADKPPQGSERAGHLPGAKHIFFERVLNEDGTFKSADELQKMFAAEGVTPDKPVITYCTAGWRAGYVWLVLKYLLGYADVRNYDASWNEWGCQPDTRIEQPQSS